MQQVGQGGAGEGAEDYGDVVHALRQGLYGCEVEDAQKDGG